MVGVPRIYPRRIAAGQIRAVSLSPSAAVRPAPGPVPAPQPPPQPVPLRLLIGLMFQSLRAAVTALTHALQPSPAGPAAGQVGLLQCSATAEAGQAWKPSSSMSVVAAPPAPPAEVVEAITPVPLTPVPLPTAQAAPRPSLSLGLVETPIYPSVEVYAVSLGADTRKSP